MELTEQCNWNSLMSVLTLGEEDKKVQEEGIFATIRETLQAENFKANIKIITSWYMRSKNLNVKTTVTYYKRVLTVDELPTRAKEIYEQIIHQCPTDEDILKVKKLIDEGPPVNKKVSGRTIDTLVTRFPRYHNVCYYLDVTDPKNTFIVKHSEAPGRKIMLFDIGSSYRKKMHQYSKTYFDCFGRGDEVQHKLSNGTTVNISICQFTFFIWASRFKVLEFLKDEFDRVIVVRQQSQKNTYKPKRRKRRKTKKSKAIVVDLKKTVLCPKISHDKKRKRGNDKVVMRSSNVNKPKKRRIHAIRQPRSKPLFDYMK